MLKPLDSHKPVTVSTVMTTDRPDILRVLKSYEFDSKDRLSRNYQSINWFDYEAISLYRRNRKIVGFSTMSHRPEYYADGEIRILNRYYEAQEMRRTSKVFADDHVCLMVKQQLKLAKKLGYTKAFISRQRSPVYFKKFIRTMAEKTGQDWVIEKDKVAVCNPEVQDCWQYKAWINL